MMWKCIFSLFAQMLVAVMLLVLFLPFQARAEEEQTPFLVEKVVNVPGRYFLGYVRDVSLSPSDVSIGKTVGKIAMEKKVEKAQVRWFEKGKKRGPGLLAVGELECDGNVSIMRPSSAKEAQILEKMLGIPTTPEALSQAYLENQVVADDDFQGKAVVFVSTVSEIAKGAFNRPYVFFPSSEGLMTGLTCYFDIKSPELRRIRKGSQVLVRGVVKGFLMQDVILEQCEIIQVR